MSVASEKASRVASLAHRVIPFTPSIQIRTRPCGDVVISGFLYTADLALRVSAIIFKHQTPCWAFWRRARLSPALLSQNNIYNM